MNKIDGHLWANKSYDRSCASLLYPYLTLPYHIREFGRPLGLIGPDRTELVVKNNRHGLVRCWELEVSPVLVKVGLESVHGGGLDSMGSEIVPVVYGPHRQGIPSKPRVGLRLLQLPLVSSRAGGQLAREKNVSTCRSSHPLNIW